MQWRLTEHVCWSVVVLDVVVCGVVVVPTESGLVMWCGNITLRVLLFRVALAFQFLGKKCLTEVSSEG